MLRISAILALLVAGGAYSQSQPPAPSPTKGSQQPQAQSKNAKQPTAPDQRGTEKSPLVVKTLPAPNAEAKAKREADQEKEKATNDKLIAYSTVAIAVITFFLALYTAKLWRATVKLGSDAKDAADRQAAELQKSLAIAKESADAAMLQAKAAVAAELPIIGWVDQKLVGYNEFDQPVVDPAPPGMPPTISRISSHTKRFTLPCRTIRRSSG